MVITREVKEAIENAVSQAIIKSLQNKDIIKSLTDNVAVAIINTIETRLGNLEETVASLKVDINSTKTNLERKIEELNEKFDRLDQGNRRMCLRIFNLKEKEKEDTRNEIINLINSKMGLNLKYEDINLCYRIGKQDKDKARAVYLKLNTIENKQTVYAKKKLLKGTGVVIKEDLTNLKLELVNQLTSLVGLKKCVD
uniref:Uncharacterized protein LOC114343111 isoform X1 n=1 Tax=Diabrotica virgifera virgifera TaxID=50390 RepID=A0A6P7GIJ4_DIAVI